MKKYNLYYKGSKLNTYPLTNEELNNILSQKEINKNKKFSNIPIENINIIKTTII